MGITIIIKDSVPKGKNRTRTDRLLHEKWGTTSFRNAEDFDKAQFLERKIKKYHGADDSRVTGKQISDVE